MDMQMNANKTQYNSISDKNYTMIKHDLLNATQGYKGFGQI